MGRVRQAGCWLHGADVPVVARGRAEWPALLSSSASALERGAFTALAFDKAVAVRAVIAHIAAEAAPTSTAGGGLVVAYAGRRPTDGLDPAAKWVPDGEEPAPESRDVPADVVLAGPEPVTVEPHHVLRRAPFVVREVPVEPVDEAVVNPSGWRKAWERDVTDVTALGLGERLAPAAVSGLRELQGVRVRLGETPTRLVAGLAMAGVPLLARGADPHLAPALAAALTASPDLDDPLEREQHSLTVRRAALETHSTLAFRRDLAGRAGVRFVTHPSVSVLLATRRPEQLDFALGQVARQDVEVELVLATHGFRADPARVAQALGDKPYRLVEQAPDTAFGDVLRAAHAAAGGDLLIKMDDDDWYSPRFVRDLLLARRYSGAEVVGMPSEFVHLADLDVTVRRNQHVEAYAGFVAGGAVLVERSILAEIGGFRSVHRFVDAQLLAGVQAVGGRVYRTHGLGYVLHRRGTGHTWAQDSEAFRRERIVHSEWPGFRPPAEIEAGGAGRP
jgi:hypothetical protein